MSNYGHSRQSLELTVASICMDEVSHGYPKVSYGALVGPRCKLYKTKHNNQILLLK